MFSVITREIIMDFDKKQMIVRIPLKRKTKSCPHLYIRKESNVEQKTCNSSSTSFIKREINDYWEMKLLDNSDKK